MESSVITFLINEEGTIYAGDIDMAYCGNHIRKGWNLSGDEQEVDWRRDQTIPDVITKNASRKERYALLILSKYKTIDELIASITIGKALDMTFHYKDGLLHNDNVPAVTYPGGTVAYYQKGVLHNENGPAWITKDGQYEYRLNGKLHRLDGPALNRYNHIYGRVQQWYKDGKLHNPAGPAEIYGNTDPTFGSVWTFMIKNYWIEGVLIKRETENAD